MQVTILEPEATPIVKKRVCAYARVSTNSLDQADSLENQTIHYRNKIESNPDYEFAGIFADRGYSGTKDNRPEFQKMMSLCRQGKIDLILVKSVSRFARNTTIVLQYIRELRSLGVEVHFEEQNLNTLSMGGELMLTALSAFAEEESRSVSENIKWRIRKKFERGELIISTKRFLGYDKDEYGDLVINQKEAQIVRRIYEDYLVGTGSFIIAKELNAQGIPTVTGAKWHDTTILEILKNEKYKGDALLQKYYRPDHLCKRNKRNINKRESFYVRENHSPIVSVEMWEQVQKELKIRRRNKKVNNKKHTLSGLLICSKCGCKLQRRVWNSGKPCEKIMWQCSNYIKNGKAVCSGTAIEERILDGLNIKGETIVKEWMKNGKKHYTYTSNNRRND
ncbi:recombinase family protein [Cellulosilyticum sp. WCF-2]|uniref:recombinase family protein n=1 Tax=Cellulosilyticum sp. WCF-2 TaxID=2497860 RepID=UPI000F8CB845|nr:recombinase family protein [Cellulosilyticum sp. WCF-2]QEH69377.1 recombinase family protein [Cellulosilyticum sp. WCF-2]